MAAGGDHSLFLTNAAVYAAGHGQVRKGGIDGENDDIDNADG